jgi:hypothetical protein
MVTYNIMLSFLYDLQDKQNKLQIEKERKNVKKLMEKAADIIFILYFFVLYITSNFSKLKF